MAATTVANLKMGMSTVEKVAVCTESGMAWREKCEGLSHAIDIWAQNSTEQFIETVF